MAGFDYNNQRHVSVGGANIEFGTATFVADTATVDIPTLFSRVIGGVGSVRPGTSETGTLTHSHMIFCDRTITNGQVTWHRKGDYIGDAPVIDYIMWGY